VILPYGLGIWSGFTTNIIKLPAVHNLQAGLIMLLAGIILMIWGMASLYFFGKGLPMNAFPPENFVTKGAYAFFRHPIYVGFGITLIGLGILSGSASFLWLVTPVTLLCTIALVMGYEALDVEKRFSISDWDPLFHIVRSNSDSPRFFRRLIMFFMVTGGSWITAFIIWVANQQTIFETKPPVQIFDGYPVIIGLLSIIAFGVPAFVLKENFQIRTWMISAYSYQVMLIYLALVIPIGANGIRSSIIFYPRISSSNWQFYVNLTIANIGLLVVSAHYLITFTSRTLYLIIIYLAVLLSIQFLYPLPWIHVTAGLIVYIVSVNRISIWNKILQAGQYFANAWKEWVIGPVRIINHGIYVGAGAFLGIFLAGTLAGAEHIWGIVLFALIVEVFAGLWAQLIEGSEKLKRPFGYYGGLVGILFSGIFIWLLGFDPWLIITACAVVAPWIQAAGRIRCLINGCCHGKPVDNPANGIRYFHERSRVLTISKMEGIPLHPTQVYSISWLFFCGFILLSFWRDQMPFTFISGMYLILTSTGRFVEEAYRGEIQTVIINKLRLYQWTAITAVLIGIILTCINLPLEGVSGEFSWQIPIGALLLGLFTFFAMGVDFPRSNARFSRLV